MRRWRSKEIFVYIAGFARPAIRRAKGDSCMKTWKHCTFTVFFAIFSIVFAFMACDNNGNNEPPDPPRFQGGTGNEITDLFGLGYNVTVQGDGFTNAEWKGVADTIRDAFNESYRISSENRQGVYRMVYSQDGGVIITVEKNPGYERYKTEVNEDGIHGNKMYLNFGILEDTEKLMVTLFDAALRLNSNTADFAKALPPLPKHTHEAAPLIPAITGSKFCS
jgi:hypothetical protein